MSKSLLCRRISLCYLISRLNEEGCFNAIRSLQNVMGYDDFSDFICKIFMDSSHNWKPETLIQLENQLQQHQKKTNNSSNIDTEQNNNQNKQVKFPLLRLPIDLITKTSLFLNEKDIFQFEQCCRLFYQMINNSLYLNQSNNFKTFEISIKRFDKLK